MKEKNEIRNALRIYYNEKNAFHIRNIISLVALYFGFIFSDKIKVIPSDFTGARACWWL